MWDMNLSFAEATSVVCSIDDKEGLRDSAGIILSKSALQARGIWRLPSPPAARVQTSLFL